MPEYEVSLTYQVEADNPDDAALLVGNTVLLSTDVSLVDDPDESGQRRGLHAEQDQY
jgi:hypothetical protein